MKSIEQFKHLVKPGERLLLALSFAYFFFLLAGYFVLRPIREQMGVAVGVDNYKWLYLGTLVTMLSVQPIYGAIVSRYTRRVFLPYIYAFFTSMILLFWIGLTVLGGESWLARAFFIFISVYNLFVVSLFWSFMADIYTPAQGKRLYGLIAAGGSTGGIVGPLLTSFLVKHTGTVNLLLFAVLMMVCVLLILLKLRLFARDSEVNREVPMGGSALEGIRLVFSSRFLQQIALMTILAVLIGSVLYYFQGHFIQNHVIGADRQTRAFSLINTATNAITLFFQFVLTPYLMQNVRIPRILAILPSLMVLALALIGLVPLIQVALGAIILQRSGAYGLMKPPSDWLFIALDQQTKYKFKNFLDTVIYRIGDVFAQTLFIPLVLWLVVDIRLLALVAMLMAGLWVWNAYTVGRMAMALQPDNGRQN